jgi:hypothetical protein
LLREDSPIPLFSILTFAGKVVAWVRQANFGGLLMRTILVSLLAACAAAAAMAAPSTASISLDPTHRQADILKPARDNQALTLHSFVLDGDGNIIAAVSAQAAPRAATKPATGGTRGWLQVYNPEKKLLREIPLSFVPSALALAPGGQYLAAGEGEIARYTNEGMLVDASKVLTLLNLDPDTLRKEVLEEHKRNEAEYAKQRIEQLQAMRDQLTRLEAKPPAGRTARDNVRIQSMKAMIQGMAGSAGEPSGDRLEQMTQYRLRVPSISAAPDGVVVTLNRNRGYEVWRTGMKFENPRRIIGDLRGCCGQMDMVTAGNRIFTAENTKFRVGIYDLNGKNLQTFGERYKDGNNGFGSCCNPMNVLGCSNGDIITAESSIGHIKRFSADGKLQAVVGRARIGGGCKHVALGFDERRDRYYVQYEDMNHICVLMTNREAAPLVAAQDKLLKQADTAALKFVGKWVAVASPGAAPRPATNDPFDYDPVPYFENFSFNADHSLTLGLTPGGPNPGDNGFRRWYAAGSSGDRVQFEIESADGYVQFTADITVRPDDQIELKHSRETKIFRRQK